MSSFSHWHLKRSSSKRIALKVDVIGPKIDCLQACPCIFQPGNCAGRGSEGVNVVVCPAGILGTNCDQYLSTVHCCFTSTETVRLFRTGSPRRPPRPSHSSGTREGRTVTQRRPACRSGHDMTVTCSTAGVEHLLCSAEKFSRRVGVGGVTATRGVDDFSDHKAVLVSL